MKKVQRNTGDNGKKREYILIVYVLIRVVPPVSGPLRVGGVPPFSIDRKEIYVRWLTKN